MKLPTLTLSLLIAGVCGTQAVTGSGGQSQMPAENQQAISVNNVGEADSSETEWVIVNVEKTGEFAETYLTQNDYDWGAAKNVKVTGNINDIDLSAIKKLTALERLDLSATDITGLPSRFMDNRTTLIEVKLPETVNKIGSYAFRGCTSLSNFDLHGVTTIEDNVFSDCNSLSYINLTGVHSIGDFAFSYCDVLDNIDLSTVTVIENSAFYSCESLKSADLSSTVTIGYSAFCGCFSLKDVKFGDTLLVMEDKAFSDTAVESINLPESLTVLDSNVFYNCKNLNNVQLPSKLTTIGSRSFYGCTSLKEITMPATVNVIGERAFCHTGITTFKCLAAVPPTAKYTFIGEGMDMSRTYLYVPSFSKDFYRNTLYWSDFNLMRSLSEPVDYILVDRPLTINLEEEDNELVANNPAIRMTAGYDNYSYIEGVGQLTAQGEGTLSAGEMTIDATLSRRSYNSSQYIPTLINYADKMRADNVTVNLSFYNRYSYSPEWHFISLPFDVKVSDIVPSNDTYWVIRRYDSAARAAGETASTWVNLTADDTLEAGKGYIVAATGGESYTDEYGYTSTANPRLSFTSGNSLTKNNLFRPNDIIVTLSEYTSEFAHNRSWNLIGNPYPCYFDMHFLNEEFTAPVTIWNGYSYVAYSPVDDNLVLAPYEAFFVQCPLEATEMTFKEEGRLHAADGKPLYKTPSMTAATVTTEDRNIFNFEVSSGDFSDRARIVLNPEAAMEYEVGRDASKFFAEENTAAQLYVDADICYSIMERPLADGTAALGLRAPEGQYVLSLSGRYASDWKVIVTDRLTGKSIDLTASDYAFTSAADDAADRFAVKFMLDSRDGIDAITGEFGEYTIVTVCAISGETVYTGRLSELKVDTAGIYVISDGQKSRKAILK